ncbi:hypothetical protein [uncultured Clostridium sp.]|uniref:hypothetical protein n=1 Tax=uncultured Clostridium sp. TaxID=59620 RepID=UPI0026293B01|nr:hypothetical protein [uncultured Clostridium sp.]MCI8310148.1 hypothetical protein [Clostridia bacterium]
MENLHEKAYFNIGNSEYYEGYYIKENRWNGWARPYFEKCIAELFVNNFSTNDFQIVYDKYTDCYICKTLENGKVIQTDIAEKKVIDTKNGAKEVYDFGSIGWTWYDYTLEEIKSREDIHIITPDKLIDEHSINLDY